MVDSVTANVGDAIQREQILALDHDQSALVRRVQVVPNNIIAKQKLMDKSATEASNLGERSRNTPSRPYVSGNELLGGHADKASCCTPACVHRRKLMNRLEYEIAPAETELSRLSLSWRVIASLSS